MNKNRDPMAVCDNPMDYVRVALALETLAYHSKEYLDIRFSSNNRLSEEMQALLTAALKKGG